MGLFGQQVERFLDRRPQIEVHEFERQLAGLDLRKIENVVDDGQQRLTRSPDSFRMLTLLGGKRRVEQQPRHADDPVHRCPDFVAHGGEKFGFRPCGGLRGIFSGDEIPFHPLAFGDVTAGADYGSVVRITAADQRERQVDVKRVSRSFLPHHLALPMAIALQGGHSHLFDERRPFGVIQRVPMSAEQVLNAKIVHGGMGGVHVGESALLIQQGHPVQPVVDSLLQGHPGPLKPLPLCNVFRDPEEELRCPVRIEDRDLFRVQNSDPLPAGMDGFFGDFDQGPLLQGQSVLGDERLGLLAGEEIMIRLSEQLVAGDAGQNFSCLVEMDEPEGGGFFDEHHVRKVFEDREHESLRFLQLGGPFSYPPLKFLVCLSKEGTGLLGFPQAHLKPGKGFVHVHHETGQDAEVTHRLRHMGRGEEGIVQRGRARHDDSLRHHFDDDAQDQPVIVTAARPGSCSEMSDQGQRE